MSDQSDFPDSSALAEAAAGGSGDTAHDAIAVIGMACRFPGACDYDEFWQGLSQGVFSVSEIPADRWDKNRYYSPNREDENKTVSKWGGFITDIDKFDAPLFKISPREAELMDPQQRIMLEIAWTCIEDAGYAPSALRGSDTGVYVGVSSFDYKVMVEKSEQPIEAHISTGVHTSMIPNRISYEFDLRGPSMPIDTACSSSLVALDEAVHALRRGDCSAALVGGISVLCSPTHFVSFSKTGMLSPDGICKSFDEAADGYVRGEGAGFVLLKPLRQAQRDRDTIYGLIKGIGINHGGKVSTVTSPNPFAQSQAIIRAFKNANISPASVNYIEAHGTGTPKGDPIEMNALIRAYSSLGKAQGVQLAERSCGIGSVKTNIGHLEAAAGMAGLIKVLLAMKHQRLPRLLHLKRLNPRIKLDGSPFYLITEAQRWEPGVDGVRRAGISSFGFGGVNAHVLLEDYRADAASEATGGLATEPSRPLLFVVSAKTADSLRRYAQRLLDHVATRAAAADPGSPSGLPFSLESLAYSLQKREAMEERLALEASSLEELTRKLQAFLLGKTVDACWHGNVKEGQAIAELMRSTDDMAGVLKAWLIDRQSQRIAKLWVKGVSIPDWDLYYTRSADGKPPLKMRLPTYQFARKRYWFDEGRRASPAPVAAPKADARAAAPAALHPLVQQNTSTLSEQRFSAVFTGDEFFLDDHRVNHEKVLPGVAYLEMAQVALRRASDGAVAAGRQGVQLRGVQLKNVVWARPIVVGDAPVEVHIGLYLEPAADALDGFVAYEVYTGRRGETVVVHSQGKGRVSTADQPPRLDLAEVRQRLAGGGRSVEECYAAFAAMGIQYGPAHRGIEQLWAGVDDSGIPEVLARLTLPAVVADTGTRFALHPSLLDAALQASLAIGWAASASGEAAAPAQALVPFAVDSVDVSEAAFGPRGSPASLWAWIRPARDRWATGERRSFTQRMAVPFDIDLCDDQGQVQVAMRGFSFRATGAALLAAKSDVRGLLMLKPTWKEHAAGQSAKTSSVAYTDHRVVFAGFEPEGAFDTRLAIEQLRDRCAATGGAQIVFQDLDTPADGWANPTDLAALAQRFQRHAARLLEVVQRMLSESAGSSGRKLLQVVVPGEGQQRLYAALSGLVKTACLEHTSWAGQVIAIAAPMPIDRLFGHLLDSARSPEVSSFLYQGERCWAGALEEVAAPAAERTSIVNQGAWKEKGVYLITGGAGGLGKLFAREICQRVKSATLVLTGRSVLSPEAIADLQLLSRTDAAIEYRCLDVCDAQAVRALVRSVQQRHGGLDGVIHCAGVLHDNYIAKKGPAELRKVLAPKVEGTIHLDEATKDSGLDFFVMCSSTSGALGNVGQADYATANAFMDAFAQYRNSLRAGPSHVDGARRSGHTLSIDWPLWQDGGMTVDAATEQMLEQRMGMVALTTASGMEAFYRALASDEPQVLVMQGHVPQMRRKLLAAPAPRPQAVAAAVPAEAGDTLDKVQRTLLHIASKLLKLEPDDFDTRTELSEYGFDSIAYTGFANRIGEKYGIELAPTVFFDHPTIEGMAKYLCEEHRENVAGPARMVEETAVVADSEVAPAAIDMAPLGSLYRERLAPERQSPLPHPVPGQPSGPAVRAAGAGSSPIAIVGMSGCFPMARDLHEFWRNLEEGKDCIGEIPKQRWDWQALWGDPTAQANRSNIKWGGFIDGMDEFDPLFFGISPREALAMDPQQRLLMTHVWGAIEDAGYSASSLSGSNTAIIVGTASVGYGSLIAKANVTIEGYSAMATVPSVGPNRMSYLLNFHGPSEPIETACSSSLVAIHKAIMAIEAGDCDQAIVGGVNTIVTPDLHLSFNKAGMLAPDGRCKTFSKDANGYVRGEGVGMLFLKRLKAAEEAGDHIYGVIRGSAENHGGRANSLTSPNSKSQADVLIKAYNRAGFDPRTVTYLETHGTGTALGDPVEINGIKTAFKTLYESTADSGVTQPRCALASVKTNIGHLELAAGVAGVMKVLLQFRHRRIAPSLHCTELNPHIDLSGTPFYVAQAAGDWTALRDADGAEIPRRAGVSSFGFGGVNAHVVLEEYIAPAAGALPTGTPTAPVMVPLSAKSPAALRRYAESLLQFLDQTPAVPLGDLAYTLQVGREALDERLGVLAHGVRDLQEKLQGYLEGREDLQDVYLGQVARNREVLAAFANDEDLQATMEVWVGKAKYGKFFGLWVKGVAFDWTTLYRHRRAGEDRPRRISAPTYPFSRERFWVGAPASAAPAQAARADGSFEHHNRPQPAAEEHDTVLQTLRALEKGAVSIDEAISAVCAVETQ